ncbi:MAG TPA: glycosyltransferase family 39 protein [Phycisphaerae bacterium]|nr:glycosyltransferase family 39 protein [Phycisphaerae bacterium]
MSDAGKTRSRRRSLGIALLLIVAVQGVGYWVVLDAGFVQDDYCWIEAAIRSLDSPGLVFSRCISGFFRPLVHLVFMGNYALAGLHPSAYLAVNILLEICCTLGLALLVYQMTGDARAAIIGAVVFASHPSHGEVVGWISARTSSLLALFGLSVLVCWLRWRQTRRWVWWICALAAFCLALLTKEEAPALLAALIILEFALPSHEGKPLASVYRQVWSAKWTLLPFLAATAGYLLLQHRFQSENPLVQGGAYTWDWAGLARDLSRLAGLFVYRGVVRTPWLYLVFGVEAVLAAAALWRAPSGARRVVIAGLALAFVALLPSSFFVTHSAARYNYVATIGSSLAWAGLTTTVTRRRALPAVVYSGVFVLLLLTIAGQMHHLGRKAAFWFDEQRQGQRLLLAAQQAAPLLEEARASGRAVRVLDVPMQSAHLHSLLWLTGGVEPSKVTLGSTSDAASRNRADDALILRWDSADGVFKTVSPN